MAGNSAPKTQNQQPAEEALSKTGSTPSGRSPQAGAVSALSPANSLGTPHNDNINTQGVRQGQRKGTARPKADSTTPAEQGQLTAWAEADAPFVSQFAERFYGLNFMGIEGSMDFLKQSVAESYYTEFISDYFPPEKIREIQEKKLILTFKASQPPKLVKLEGVADQFLVTGTLTTQNRLARYPRLLSQQPVALRINLRHIAGAKGLVYRVAVVDSAEASTAFNSSASDTTGGPSKVSSNAVTKSKKDASSPTGLAHPNSGTQPVTSSQGDPVAKFVGDAAGAAVKNAFGIKF